MVWSHTKVLELKLETSALFLETKSEPSEPGWSWSDPVVSLMVIGAELTLLVVGAVAFEEGDVTLLDGDVVEEVRVVAGDVALLG